MHDQTARESSHVPFENAELQVPYMYEHIDMNNLIYFLEYCIIFTGMLHSVKYDNNQPSYLTASRAVLLTYYDYYR
jgi:hypothetical protein